MGSALALKDCAVPYFGLYGACSTMAESLSLAAMTVDGGFADTVCALTSSHFCSSERQYRFPLEYGGVRAPTAQWTVTGAGAAILRSHGAGPYVTHVTTGCITDAGITDASNMGAAMAPAAYSTLKAHFAETGRDPFYYDAIVTGDLGMLGHDLLQSFFRADGVELGVMYMDCGMLIYDVEGSGRARRRLRLRLLRVGAVRAPAAGHGRRASGTGYCLPPPAPSCPPPPPSRATAFRASATRWP
jgi:stage V sporulation protein AD